MPNFTRKAIIDSFIKLLNDRPLNRITVKDIVEDCGINRNSFYYHFHDIPELIEQITIEAANAIIEKYPTIASLEECMDVAIQFALENKKAALHIYNSANRGMFELYLMKVCRYIVTAYINTVLHGRTIKESDMDVIVRFYTCEFFGQIILWMSDGMKDDLQTSFHRLCELRIDMLEEMIRKSAASTS